MSAIIENIRMTFKWDNATNKIICIKEHGCRVCENVWEAKEDEERPLKCKTCSMHKRLEKLQDRLEALKQGSCGGAKADEIKLRKVDTQEYYIKTKEGNIVQVDYEKYMDYFS